MLFEDKKDDNEEDANKILILTVFATVDYHSTGRYEKILCKTSSLSGNSYITELRLQNHQRYVQEVIQMFLLTLRQLEEFLITNNKLDSLQVIRLTEKDNNVY